MPELQIRKNFNDTLQKEVYTIERKDGEMLFPTEGIVSYNTNTEEEAQKVLKNIIEILKRSLN